MRDLLNELVVYSWGHDLLGSLSRCFSEIENPAGGFHPAEFDLFLTGLALDFERRAWVRNGQIFRHYAPPHLDQPHWWQNGHPPSGARS